MPQSLSGRTTLRLVAIAFGLTLAVQLLLSGQPSATAPAARRSAPPVVADAPAAKPNLRLVAAGTVPALREPRKRRPPAREPKRSVRKVTQPAPVVRPAPVQPAVTAQPVPTATPRYIPPTPPPSAPKPKPKPAPTSAPPPAGAFDTSGDES